MTVGGGDRGTVVTDRDTEGRGGSPPIRDRGATGRGARVVLPRDLGSRERVGFQRRPGVAGDGPEPRVSGPTPVSGGCPTSASPSSSASAGAPSGAPRSSWSGLPSPLVQSRPWPARRSRLPSGPCKGVDPLRKASSSETGTDPISVSLLCVQPLDVHPKVRSRRTRPARGSPNRRCGNARKAQRTPKDFASKVVDETRRGVLGKSLQPLTGWVCLFSFRSEVRDSRSALRFVKRRVTETQESSHDNTGHNVHSFLPVPRTDHDRSYP